jgi:hypothetical protein
MTPLDMPTALDRLLTAIYEAEGPVAAHMRQQDEKFCGRIESRLGEPLTGFDSRPKRKYDDGSAEAPNRCPGNTVTAEELGSADEAVHGGTSTDDPTADLTFIAAAPTIVAELVTEIEALRWANKMADGLPCARSECIRNADLRAENERLRAENERLRAQVSESWAGE